MLSAADSNDPDGDPLTYKWTWAIDANVYEANGLSPTIELPVGTHTIQLVVNDGIVNSAPDDVNVVVVAPVKGNLCVMPVTINRRSNQPNILTNIRLSPGIKKTDIDPNQPLMLYPGGIKANWRGIVPCNERGRQIVSIFAFFDKDDLMNAIPTNGFKQVQVVGKLKSGQVFYGCDTVRIIDLKWQFPWCKW